jgi:hypothetical protein
MNYSLPSTWSAAKDMLDVEHDAVAPAKFAYLLDTHFTELAVGHGEHDAIIRTSARTRDRLESVLVLGNVRIDPRIVDLDARTIDEQLPHHVDHACVADIGTILLEGEPEHEDPRIAELDALADHQLRDALRDVDAHAVVEPATRQDHFRVVADGLGLVRQVVRINADAMTADQAGPERQEVPLAAGRLQHFLRVDAEAVEDQGQLVDQRNVDVALCILDDLRGFSDLDARCTVRAGRDDRAVQRIDEIRDFGRRAGCHLADRREAVLLVAGIDAFRAVAGIEVAVEPEFGDALEDRHADLLCAAGIDG